MKKLLLFLPFFLTGCIGIGIVHQEKIKDSHCSGASLQNFQNLTYLEKNEENLSVYKRKIDEFNLKGIVPMIGIGIPLVVPFGYNFQQPPPEGGGLF